MQKRISDIVHGDVVVHQGVQLVVLVAIRPAVGRSLLVCVPHDSWPDASRTITLYVNESDFVELVGKVEHELEVHK